MLKLEKDIEKNLKKELCKEFQLERMIFFSDAVFAIAITLLILDVKVPHSSFETSDKVIINHFLEILPNFLAFILSFFVIGLHWVSHHSIFGYVIRYDKKLLRINIFYLFTIVLMPFSTALNGEFFMPQVHFPWAFYTANICLTGLLRYLLIKHIADPKNKLAVGFTDKNLILANLWRSWMAPIFFTIGLLLTFTPLGSLGKFTPFLFLVYCRY